MANEKITGDLKVTGEIYLGASEQPLSQSMTSITWSALKTLRDSGNLIPGMQYRITDYTCTTTQAESRSAGHVFDIIVVADSTNKLNENARAIQHSGDTYFANSDLNAWRLLYCLDNDTARFGWANASTGKGVIYRMIDEFENDVAYDFKNIQFKRYKVSVDTSPVSAFNDNYFGCKDLSGQLVSPIGYVIPDDSDFVWFYTFGGLDENYDSLDMSIQGNISSSSVTSLRGCVHNTIGIMYASSDYHTSSGSTKFKYMLGNNVFFAYDYNGYYEEPFSALIYNIIGDDACCNTIYVLALYNDFGKLFKYNTISSESAFNKISCYFTKNVCGDSLRNNTIASDFSSNFVGTNFAQNTVGPLFSNNKIGGASYSNTFGPLFCRNDLGSNNCQNNYGSYFSYNVCGNYIRNSTFGNNVQRNNIGTSSSSNNVYAQYLRIDDGVQYVSLECTDTTMSYSNMLQNVHIHTGVKGASTSNMLTITVPDRALTYESSYTMTGSTEYLI